VKAGRLHAKLFSQTLKTLEKREENSQNRCSKERKIVTTQVS
jgi:hypothetical protein